MLRTAFDAIVVLCWMFSPADAFNQQRVYKPKGFMKMESLRGDLQAAMAEALGQYHDVDFVKYDIRAWVEPMFKTLPQISSHEGHVELRAMEHTLHRYFMKRYSLSLRPFEPHRPFNATTDVLGDRVPAFVEEILRGRFYHNGFSLDDAVSMVATMEQFLYDDTLRRISKSHDSLFESSLDHDITEDQAVQIIGHSIQQVDKEPQGEQSIVPPRGSLDWGTEQIIKGELHRILYKRTRRARQAALKSQDSFTLDEVAHAGHALVLSMQKLFATCERLRKHMANLDPKNTGRVTLSDLYWNSNAGEFELRESKDWLKRLGALDESSTWKGPQVIIPNYVGGASNCIVTTQLYRVCCPSNECEHLLSRVEAEVQAPTGSPHQIMPVILESIAQGDVKTIMPLSKKLWEVAQHHDNRIPLHGRLFQQWLHYVKPQECPYPHKRGSVELVNLAGCGTNCAIDDVKAAARDSLHVPLEGPVSDEDDDDAAWMSQWALEEELVVSTGTPLYSDMGERLIAFLAASGFFASALCIFKIAASQCSSLLDQLAALGLGLDGQPVSTKSHLV